MSYYFLFLSLLIFVTSCVNSIKSELVIADFTNNEDLSRWAESSDMVREQGMSKGALVMQETQLFKRAVFFAMLNPQPNGACFAGVIKNVTLDLSPYRSIKVKVRGQGQFDSFKVIMRHKGQFGDGAASYSQIFTAPQTTVGEVSINLEDFRPYWRGKPSADAEPLDTSQITTIGLQAYGGVYMPTKQSGVASLEIDWIKAI